MLCVDSILEVGGRKSWVRRKKEEKLWTGKPGEFVFLRQQSWPAGTRAEGCGQGRRGWWALRGLYREGACTPYGEGNAGHGTALTGACCGQGAAVLAGPSQVQVPSGAIVPRRPFGETWLRR